MDFVKNEFTKKNQLLNNENDLTFCYTNYFNKVHLPFRKCKSFFSKENTKSN